MSLVLALFGLLALANVLISGTDSLQVGAFPITVLVVAAPVALFLFLRLRHAELASPALRRDPSRRKVVQAILLITFLAVIIHTIVLLYLVLSGHYTPQTPYYYDGFSAQPASPSFIADLIRWLITLAVAGGVFVYYWLDEHRL